MDDTSHFPRLTGKTSSCQHPPSLSSCLASSYFSSQSHPRVYSLQSSKLGSQDWKKASQVLGLVLGWQSFALLYGCLHLPFRSVYPTNRTDRNAQGHTWRHSHRHTAKTNSSGYHTVIYLDRPGESLVISHTDPTHRR